MQRRIKAVRPSKLIGRSRFIVGDAVAEDSLVLGPEKDTWQRLSVQGFGLQFKIYISDEDVGRPYVMCLAKERTRDFG